MAQETLVFILGLLLFITPFLGIPEQWKLYVYIGIATLLLIIGYRLRYARFIRTLEAETGERQTDSYAESAPAVDTTTRSNSPATQS